MSNIRVASPRESSAWFGSYRFRADLWLAILGILFFTHTGFASAAKPDAKNILVLYSFSDPSVYDPVASLKADIRSRVPGPVNFYIEHMESQRFDDEDYLKSLAETFHHAYSRNNLDLVIAVSYPALRFAVQYRDKMFPGVPIVFLDVNARRIANEKWTDVTGVTVFTDVRGTIDLALRLHPDTKSVAVLSNNSPFESYWFSVVQSELLRHRDKVTEIDFVGPASAAMLEKATTLPPHTVVLFQIAPQLSNESAIGIYDLLAAVGQHAPTYCIWPRLCTDHGGIGGVYADETEQSRLIAGLVQRVLSGERPENIPIQHGTKNEIRVVWSQLRKWHIPESALPAGSVILDRQPTFWERDRKYLIFAILLFLAQAALIAGLLSQRARKRKAEAILRESEQRFRVMADTTPSLVWMCDSRGEITYLNERRIAFTGPEPDAGYGDSWIEYVHPDDRKNVRDIVLQGLQERKPFSKEYRLRRSDGVYRWMFDVASPRVNGDGSFAGFIGSAIDVTDQKVAQQSLEQVSGKLIEAQEKERSRIARDLHDDICQRLALLSMEIEQANRASKNSPTSASGNLEDIRKHCSEIAGDVQSLSHQLHSSKLEYLGVTAALGGFCKEFSKQHDVRIQFKERDVPPDVPREVSLCLFRVAQEALSNALKYSGVRQFAVDLTATVGEIQLTVMDSGAGFDVEAAKKNRGLGLVSMQERVHLVHGSLHIESEPGEGTRIFVVVPFVSERQTSSQNGSDENRAGVPGAV